MERKLEIRYQPDQPIRLSVLGGVLPRTIVARIVQLFGKRAEVRIEESISLDSAVKINLDDSMLLGEVVACAPQGGGFVALIDVQEAIPSMSDLARLVAAVMNEGRSEMREQAAARATAAR